MRSNRRIKAAMPGMVKGSRRQVPAKAESAPYYEVDVVPGLEAVAYQELKERLGKQARFRRGQEEVVGAGIIQFFYTGELPALLRLQTVFCVYVVLFFDVARPKALLGHEHFHRLLETIKGVRQLSPPNVFSTLYVDAAGSDSAVMLRIKDELAVHLALRVAADDGDLVLRMRRPQNGKPGWELLIRLSPRPLSVRPWRVCNRAGGLNAALAQAMVRLTQPHREDCFLNLGCGSGTLLIERRAFGQAKRLLGCDIDAEAVACARINAEASGYGEKIELFEWDAQAVPLPAASVDVICADLPFGKAIGSHRANLELYPKLLQEAARAAKAGARLCLLTHEVHLLERLLDASEVWKHVDRLNLTVGGLHPRIYRLRKAN